MWIKLLVKYIISCILFLFVEYLWVEDDICEVQLKLTNPLPFELKVSNMRLLTSGVVFESIPETIVLAPDSPTTVNLHGTPKEIGELQVGRKEYIQIHTIIIRNKVTFKSGLYLCTPAAF